MFILIKKITELFKKKKDDKPKPIKVTLNVPDFNKNKIFEDYVFAYKQMNIQAFLEVKQSFLATLQLGQILPAKWIDQSCTLFNVNPRLILTLLEKHYGLITAKTSLPMEVLNKALNIGVSETMGTLPVYQGLDKQIYNCAKNHRRFFDLFVMNGRVKVNCVDDDTVVAENAITYAMYMNDPFVGTEDLYKKYRPDADGDIPGALKIELVKKAPFGVYKTCMIWKELFENESSIGVLHT